MPENHAVKRDSTAALLFAEDVLEDRVADAMVSHDQPDLATIDSVPDRDLGTRVREFDGVGDEIVENRVDERDLIHHDADVIRTIMRVFLVAIPSPQPSPRCRTPIARRSGGTPQA